MRFFDNDFPFFFLIFLSDFFKNGFPNSLERLHKARKLLRKKQIGGLFGSLIVLYRAQPEANVQLTQFTKSLPDRGATSSGVSDRTIKFSGQMPTRKPKSELTEERKKYNKTPLPHKTGT